MLGSFGQSRLRLGIGPFRPSGGPPLADEGVQAFMVHGRCTTLSSRVDQGGVVTWS